MMIGMRSPGLMLISERMFVEREFGAYVERPFGVNLSGEQMLAEQMFDVVAERQYVVTMVDVTLTTRQREILDVIAVNPVSSLASGG